MSQTHCPHCGAENFTMEGWEDLDHCSSCGKPLGELKRVTPEKLSRSSRGRARARGSGARDDRNAKRPRPA